MSRPSARGARTRRLAVATVALLAGATQFLGTSAAAAATWTDAGHAMTVPECAGLDQMSIPASVMSLPTTGGRVASTSVKTSVVSGVTIEYCQVDADIFPVDPSAPDIKMRVALPYGWNRKALMFGGGGYNGTIPDLARTCRSGRPTSPRPWPVGTRRSPATPATSRARPPFRVWTGRSA